MHWMKRGLVVFSLLALAGTSACGDDDNGNGDVDAGGGTDAASTDAGPNPDTLRSGVVAVLDTKVIDATGATLAAGGVV